MRYESGHFFTALAAIGGASLLFVGASMGKLALALRNNVLRLEMRLSDVYFGLLVHLPAL